MRQLVFNRVRKIVKSIVLLDSRGFIVVIDLHETARSSVTVHRKATVVSILLGNSEDPFTGLEDLQGNTARLDCQGFHSEERGHSRFC